MVASLCVGLGDDSRIKRKINKQPHKSIELLMIALIDKLNILIWQNSGSKSRQPKSILEDIMNKENNVNSFNSAEEFEKARKRIIRKGM